MPDVSVVVPTKDRLPYLQGAISSFLAQDEVKEVIIVIDGCRDGTLQYLVEASAAEARIRYVDNVTNKGVAYSRNRGIELARCEYMFMAEDDLTLSENFFATLLAHMRETGADIISARNIFRGEHEAIPDAIARTDRITGPSINRSLITVEVGIDTGTDSLQPLLPGPMLGRTEIFQKIKFDDYYRGTAWREESDFQLEAWKSGYKLAYCPHTVSFNLMIENDRGGVHSSVGFKRVKSIVKSNWYFIRKHRDVISREFGITNLYFYIVRFAVWKTSQEIVMPSLLNAGRRILGRHKRT
jgi:glycosyltransferase involved in cell wall biosynthesis